MPEDESDSDENIKEKFEENECIFDSPILEKIAKNLEFPGDLLNLALTNKANLAFFKPLLKKAQENYKPHLNEFLQYIVESNVKEAKKLLQNEPRLSIIKCKIIDHSNRIFPCCSPIQYTIWAGDAPMFKLIIDTLLTTEKISKEESNTVLKILISQIKVLLKKGLSYSLNAKVHQEKYFDFHPILKAFNTYITKGYNWSWPNKKIFFIQTIGSLERELPAHIPLALCSHNWGKIETREEIQIQLSQEDISSSSFPTHDNSRIIKPWFPLEDDFGKRYAMLILGNVVIRYYDDGPWHSTPQKTFLILDELIKLRENQMEELLNSLIIDQQHGNTCLIL
ncbi:MAG: hypothetical protein LCH30_03030 [Proteobacteria bacterium]|nr:hypothetical protein [Pseudomonadota bacterium]